MWITRWKIKLKFNLHWWMIGGCFAWPYILLALGPFAIEFNREQIHI